MRQRWRSLILNQPRPPPLVRRRFSSNNNNEDRLTAREWAYLVAGATTTGYVLWQIETVPYSRRWHFMLLPVWFERWRGERAFKDVKNSSSLLNSTDPRSVKVNTIANNILTAMKEDIDQPVDGVAGKGAMTKRLTNFHWEVVVVDNWEVNAYCLPGGKIVVNTGLLRAFSRDDEIATVIGHEIGHCIARHYGETITKEIFFLILRSIISALTNNKCNPYHLQELSKYALTLPFSRRMEKEADYIGLLLMARGGYNPRVAPSVFSRLSGAEGWQKYLSTHPSGEERAKLLAQDKVMTKAIKLYDEKDREFSALH